MSINVNVYLKRTEIKSVYFVCCSSFLRSYACMKLFVHDDIMKMHSTMCHKNRYIQKVFPKTHNILAQKFRTTKDFQLKKLQMKKYFILLTHYSSSQSNHFQIICNLTLNTFDLSTYYPFDFLESITFTALVRLRVCFSQCVNC